MMKVRAGLLLNTFSFFSACLIISVIRTLKHSFMLIHLFLLHFTIHTHTFTFSTVILSLTPLILHLHNSPSFLHLPFPFSFSSSLTSSPFLFVSFQIPSDPAASRLKYINKNTNNDNNNNSKLNINQKSSSSNVTENENNNESRRLEENGKKNLFGTTLIPKSGPSFSADLEPEKDKEEEEEKEQETSHSTLQHRCRFARAMNDLERSGIVKLGAGGSVVTRQMYTWISND